MVVEVLVAGAAVGKAFALLTDALIDALKKMIDFKDKLIEMKQTMDDLGPILERLQKLNKRLDRPNESYRFESLLVEGRVLVAKCERVGGNFCKRWLLSKNLDKMNKSLTKYVTLHNQLLNSVDTKDTLVKVTDMEIVTGNIYDEVKDMKAMMLKKSPYNDCSTVVVSAAGWSRKMFCNDPEIPGRFGRNIYYVEIPEKYDIELIIKSLLEKNQPRDFDSDEVAIQQWGSFLGDRKSEIVLIVDDVRSESTINHLKSPKYKILVTSRESLINQVKTYQLSILNDDQDAANLFRCSLFSEHRNEDRNIRGDLVDKKNITYQLLEGCNFPFEHSGNQIKDDPKWISLATNVPKDPTRLSMPIDASDFNLETVNVIEKEFIELDQPIGGKAEERKRKSPCRQGEENIQFKKMKYTILEESHPQEKELCCLKGEKMEYDKEKKEKKLDREDERLRLKAEKMVYDKEKEERKLRQKDERLRLKAEKIELAKKNADQRLMMMDVSVMPKMQRLYFEELQREVMRRRKPTCDSQL